MGEAQNGRWLRTPEAAAYANMSESLLRKLRMRGGGPAYLKVSPKLVLYARSDLDAWLEGCRRRSTSDVA